MATQAFLVLALFASSAFCQPTPPNSFPHAYPGEPTGELSPEWQRCESMVAQCFAFLSL